MTSEQQLLLWLEGQPVHRHGVKIKVVDGVGNVVEEKEVEGGECCPDFSCCQPELLAPIEVRRAFYHATEEERFAMLSMFLGAAMKHWREAKQLPGEVYVAGDPTNYQVPS